MNQELFVQLLGYIISGVVALIIASLQHSKISALIEYRLEQLEKKVDKHNNFMERLALVETKLSLKEKEKQNG